MPWIGLTLITSDRVSDCVELCVHRSRLFALHQSVLFFQGGGPVTPDVIQTELWRRFGSGAVNTRSAVPWQVPTIYAALIEHSTLHDDFGLKAPDGTTLVIAVERGSGQWPDLLISQRFDPGPEAGFYPGAFLVPETHLLFVGAGTRLLAYDLQKLRRIWEDAADTGFWGWKRHGDVIVMSAELELAAWTLEGRNCWSTFVEPPWGYEVRGARVYLDVMGRKSVFDLGNGPSSGEAG